jgi:hypothetical protein
MMQLRARTAKIWSAVTCHRFCGFGDWSPKQNRWDAPLAFDGDKSPAESADESAHSKAGACRDSRVRIDDL